MATLKTRHDVADVGTSFLVVMVTCSCVAWPASSSGRDSAVVDGQVAHLWHPHLSPEVDAALGGELVSSYSGSEVGAQQLVSGSLGTRCHGSRRGEGGSCCWTRFWFRWKKSWIPGQERSTSSTALCPSVYNLRLAGSHNWNNQSRAPRMCQICVYPEAPLYRP